MRSNRHSARLRAHVVHCTPPRVVPRACGKPPPSCRERAIVAGATGYSGRDLIRLLLNHPQIDLIGAFASRSGETISLTSIHPQLTGLTDMDCQPFDEATIAKLDPELIFLATPNEFSH